MKKFPEETPKISDEWKSALIEQLNYEKSDNYVKYMHLDMEFLSSKIEEKNIQYYVNLGVSTGYECVDLYNAIKKSIIKKWFYVDCLPFVVEEAISRVPSGMKKKLDARVLVIKPETFGGDGVIGIPVYSGGSEGAGLGRRGKLKFKLPDDCYKTIDEYIKDIFPRDSVNKVSRSFFDIDIEGLDLKVSEELLRDYNPGMVRFEVLSLYKTLGEKLEESILYPRLCSLGLDSSKEYREIKDQIALHNITVIGEEIWCTDIVHSEKYKYIRLV